MKGSIIAALASAATLCACSPRSSSDCMDPGEIGRIEKISRYGTDERYGDGRPRAILRFGMRHYLPSRGAIRLCVTEDDEALALLKVGDILRPRGMTDVTP